MLTDFLPTQNNCKSVIIYGATIGGQILYYALKRYGVQVCFFCDEYTEYQEFCGRPVKRIFHLAHYPDVPVILGVTRSFQSAYDTLKKSGVHNPIVSGKALVEQFYIADGSFTPEERIRAEMLINQYPVYVEQFNKNMSKIIFPTLEVFVTEKCTLRCRDCSHMIFNYSSPKHYNMKPIIDGLERILEFAEIHELLILGGEPLLHPHLEDLLAWCQQNKARFRNMTLITNGTILPKNSIVTLIKQCELNVRISNYGKLSAKLDELHILCQKESIPYFTPNEKWIDFGRGKKHDYTNSELQEMFSLCPFSYDYLLLNGRIFRCAHGAHLYNQGMIPLCKADYVEVFDNTQNLEENLIKFFCLDRMNVCRFCNGTYYTKSIEPAIQM